MGWGLTRPSSARAMGAGPIGGGGPIVDNPDKGDGAVERAGTVRSGVTPSWTTRTPRTTSQAREIRRA